MEMANVADSTAREPAARSRLYQCFAAAFSHPTEDLLCSIFNGEFLNTLILLGDRLPYDTPFEVSAGSGVHALAPEGGTRELLSHFYTTNFESGGHAISLRESAYSSLTEPALMEEIFRFYQFFGLDLSSSHLSELPDQLPIELEFLHYLTYLEAKAQDTPGNEQNSAALRRGQKDFIHQHLGSWLGSFRSRLQNIPDAGFYISIADLLHLFIQSEERFLQPVLTS